MPISHGTCPSLKTHVLLLCTQPLVQPNSLQWTGNAVLGSCVTLHMLFLWLECPFPPSYHATFSSEMSFSLKPFWSSKQELYALSLLKTFYFVLGVYPINNVVIVSGKQRRDSAIHVHVSVLLQTPLPSKLPHSIEQSSMCCTIGPCWLTILNIAVCTCPSQTKEVKDLYS